MSATIKDSLHHSIDLLGEIDLNIIYTLVQRMLVSYDFDYTMITNNEEKRIQKGLQELQDGNYINFDTFIKEQGIEL